MAALLATILPDDLIFGPAAVRGNGSVADQVRGCWTRDAVTGALVCAWTTGPDRKKPNLHLKLVRA